MSLNEFGTRARPRSSRSSGPQFIEGEYLDEAERKKVSLSEWTLAAPDTFVAVPKSDAKLPSGAYEIGKDERSGMPLFKKKELVHDTIIPLSGLPSQILTEISEFWTKEKDFTNLGFLHRRGYLFYGSQGTGKSSLVQEIADSIIKEGGIVFYCTFPEWFQAGLAQFRLVEPSRQVVCVFEDIDAIIGKFGESVLLSILDGENQISRVCNIATTNYPELLDKRIVGRPRRFDRVYKIGNLDDAARETFLKKKLPAGAKQKDWLKKTKDLSIASISEVIISVYCFGKTLEESVNVIKELSSEKSSREYHGKDIGFDRDDDDEEDD